MATYGQINAGAKKGIFALREHLMFSLESCGGRLFENVPHKLMYFNYWSLVGGTVWGGQMRYGVAIGSMWLGVGFEISNTTTIYSAFHLLQA